MRSLKNELNAMQIIPKAVVNDGNLSFDARFLYVYMACKEEGWKPNVKTLAKEINYQPKDLLDLLSELIKEGWVSEVKHDDADFEYVLNMERKGLSQINDIVMEQLEKANNAKSNVPSDKNKELFEQYWVAYRRKGSKKKAYDQWKKMKDEDKELVLRHIQMYVGSRDLCYQKDFERYLRDKTFKEIIIKGNAVVYDPSKNDKDDEYKPEQSLLLAWDEKRKINIFIGFWDGTHIPDGYNDDNRPDGARVMLNNSRGIIAWSKAERKWKMKNEAL